MKKKQAPATVGEAITMVMPVKGAQVIIQDDTSRGATNRRSLTHEILFEIRHENMPEV